MLKKLRNLFKKEHADDEILELELWSYGNEGINYDEHKAWEIIKEIYHDILYKDDSWHFFYENYYNIIRCSAKFYPKVIRRLQDLGVYYKEKGKWVDGQYFTRRHQEIFKGLFHYFTLMALKEYDCEEITGIYDRLSHCFINHQYYVLEDFRLKYGHQWEAYIMNNASIARADHSAHLYYRGNDPSRSFKIDISEKSLLEQIEENLFLRKIEEKDE
jgi:hypothetical protein